VRARLRVDSTDGARLGMAISKRNAKTAVLRNRIKRVLRDRFRHLRSQLPALDLVVQLRGPISMAQTPGLADEFTQLLARACRRLNLPYSEPALAATAADQSCKDAH